jgi:V/A-type H+-transporting ATPase subunit E
MENLKSQIKFTQEIEAKEIIEDATEQARRITKEAKEKATKIKRQKTEEVLEKLREKEASELDSARLEERKKISNVKFQLEDEALAQAMERLKEIITTSSSAYQDGLRKSIIAAAAEIRASELEILTNSRDKEFVKGRLTELKKEISKLKGVQVSLKIGEESLNTVGGAIVRDKDKKQIFNSTFEARLTEVKQKLLGEISVSLFEGAED